MQELLQQLLDHLRGMWRFHRTALITAWTVGLLGWLVVLALPPVFQASSRVYVDTTAVLRPLLQGIAIDQDVQAQLNFVRQALLSMPQLERVARETDLDVKADTPEEKQRMLVKLRDDIVIDAVAQPGKRENEASSLYTISYLSSDKGQALKVVSSLMDAFVEDTLGGKRSGSESAQRFLTQQIKLYDERLSAAETKLAEFKKKNVGMVPGAEGDFFSRLQAEEDAIQKTRASLNIAVNRRQVLAGQLRGEQPYVTGTAPGTADSAAAQGLGTPTSFKIQEAEQKLQELLLRYTDKHPDVIAMRETIAQLEARQAQEAEAMRRNAAAGQSLAGMSSNPVYQQTQAAYNQASVEVNGLQSELAAHQQKIAQLRGMMDTAPEVEAEYSRLTRDYDVVKAQYNELVSRLDRAKISELAEQTGVVRFEVIDPPSVTLQPVAPNRPRLIFMVLVAALAAGAGLAYVLNQARPVFDNVRALTDVTSLPVLGAVSRTWRDRHKARRLTELTRVGIATAALVAVFVVVLLVQEPMSAAIHHVIS
jgi:polysaccharide chain length determinant protein (PEP-CTERM system associated)